MIDGISFDRITCAKFQSLYVQLLQYTIFLFFLKKGLIDFRVGSLYLSIYLSIYEKLSILELT